MGTVATAEIAADAVATAEIAETVAEIATIRAAAPGAVANVRRST
jgi:hypothetical protein